MSKSVTPPVATVVTPSTMPASFRVSSDIVLVPTLAQRTRRACDLVSLVQVAMIYDHLADVAALDEDAVREFTGYVPDPQNAMDAAGRALSAALEELHWVLYHPEAKVLELLVPTEEDWKCFQTEQQRVSEGGAR